MKQEKNTLECRKIKRYFRMNVRIQEILKAEAEAASGQKPPERIVGDYRKTLHRLTVATANAAIPELLTHQEGPYRLDSQTLLQLKESASQWISALEAKLEECAALIAQLVRQVYPLWMRRALSSI
jgi:hypothetical protein